MTCRWTSTTTPRTIVGRHVDGLGSDPIHLETCKGCLPCLETHCAGASCSGRNHVAELTCPSCIGSTRADLADLATLCEALPEQAITWASAVIPGGHALVLAGPSSTGIAQQWAETCGEDTSHKADEFGTPVPPLLLLATWCEAWCDVLGTDDLARGATVDTEVRWLSEHLHDVAQHYAFPEFAEDVRTARAGLESVLSAGRRDAIGKVRCIDGDCGAMLRQTYTDPKPCRHDTAIRREVRRWFALGYPEAVSLPMRRAVLEPCLDTDCDQGGRRDAWTCPACKRTYDDEAYRLAKRQANDERQPIRAGVEIARDLGIPAERLRKWVTRNQLQRYGFDRRGRILLDVREVRRHMMAS